MKRFLVTLITVIFLVGCGAGQETDLEKARFALDSGDWNSAIKYSESALTKDSSNVHAAIVLSAAYAGRGGFRLLDLFSVLANDFHHHRFYKALRDFETQIGALDQGDISIAIDVLIDRLFPKPVYGDHRYVDYHFQAALLYLIHAYLTPAMAAQPVIGGDVDSNNITQEIKDSVEEDLLGFDDELIEAGFSPENELVRYSRENYCVLQNASVGETGFDLEALRDLVLCQLSPNDGADLTPDDFESSLITSCADFNYDACDSAGATEE